MVGQLGASRHEPSCVVGSRIAGSSVPENLTLSVLKSPPGKTMLLQSAFLSEDINTLYLLPYKMGSDQVNV